MAGGRWYPSLLTLGDGRVLALAGLGADGNLNVVPEAYTDGAGWTALPSPGPWPMYAHLVLLADGRVYYTGGQYGGNNGSRPSMWNLTTGATTEVQGLPVPDMRNQSASLLLPPAQAQRVVILGGGGHDMHNQAPAIADVGIVDLTAVRGTGIRPGDGALDDGRQRPGAAALPLDRATSPQAGALRDISLIRPGATTHSCDNEQRHEQRLVDVPFTVEADGSLRLHLPTSPDLAPPGWYLLFGTDLMGVPSTAAWLHLS